MSKIQIYIDNQEADYDSFIGLPFQFASFIGELEGFGVSGGLSIDNSANLLAIPATTTNNSILANKEHTYLSFRTIKSGKQVFSGRCRIKSKNHQRHKLHSYNLELLGGENDILSKLEGVSLRDLDCGTVDYTQAEIEASWSATVDTDKGIFAPVIYGQLNSGVFNNWEVEDFRYHVYFDTILNAIAKYLGVTISSTFRTTSLWKKAVYLYGVGDLWRRNDTPSSVTASITLSPNTTLSATSPTAANYTLTIDLPSGYAGLDHVEIYGNGTLIEQVDYPSGGINNHTVSVPFYVAQSGTIELKGKDIADAATNMPIGTMFSARPSLEVVKGNTFNVSSCLHDFTVKQFLKSIFLMFNLRSFYNPIIKEWVIEPLFDYTIDGTTYSGFYKSPKNSSTTELNKDNAGYTKEYRSKFDCLYINYGSDKLIDDYLERFVTENQIQNFGTKTVIQSGDKVRREQVIFERLYNGWVTGVTFTELPVILPFDTDKLNDSGNTILDATFKSNAKCGYVSGKTAGITFEGVSKSAPVIMQHNVRDNSYLYTLSFCDTAFTDNGTQTDYTCKGLVSIFYEKQFAILRNLIKINGAAVITQLLDSETYRNLYKIDNELYILQSISNYNLNTRKRLVDVELIRYIGIDDTDENNTTHNSLEPNEAIISIR